MNDKIEEIYQRLGRYNEDSDEYAQAIKELNELKKEGHMSEEKKDLYPLFEQVATTVNELISEDFAIFKEINHSIEKLEESLNVAYIQIPYVIKNDELNLSWDRDTSSTEGNQAWIYSDTRNIYSPQKTIYSFYVDGIPLRHVDLTTRAKALTLLPELLSKLLELAKETKKLY